MKFHSTELSNGLSVIGEVRENAASAAVGFFVRTGARDETPDVSGVSHFLEHMMFKGTAKRSTLDVSFALGNMGAQSNAYTSEETTVYYISVLPEFFGDAFELLSDMLRPSLDQKEFDTEKNVILEEIALYLDRPTHVLFETTLREFFSAHPAGNSVIGTKESVSGISRDMMKRYFDARYQPSNIVLSAAGNFNWEKFVEDAKRHCGSWPSAKAPRQRPEHKPTPVKKLVSKPNLQTAHVCLMAKGPDANNEKRYEAKILGAILGDAVGSKTFWQLVDKGLADSASIDADDMDGAGFVMGYASAYPDKIDHVADILSSIMKQAKDFTDADLERALTKIETRLVLHGETSLRRLMAIGNGWLYRAKYSSLEDELARLKRVTRKGILEMLETFPFDPTTRVTLVPA